MNQSHPLISRLGRPVDLIEQLRSMAVNIRVNWEGILAHQYRSAITSPRTMVDIGAHEGLHTGQFLDMGAQRVICFEPLPWLAEHIRRKFPDPRVSVYEVALTNTGGHSSFIVNADTPSESGFVQRKNSPGTTRTITVVLQRLDDHNVTDASFIKIDCEGAEFLVIDGAKATIAASRPLISVEYGSAGYSVYGFTKTSMLEWAQLTRYVVSDIFGNSLDDPEVYDRCVDLYYWDYFLCPAEKWQEIHPPLQEGAERVLTEFSTFISE
jgi:FkbM family methyltransferase